MVTERSTGDAVEPVQAAALEGGGASLRLRQFWFSFKRYSSS
jgi:hypothetical protein